MVAFDAILKKLSYNREKDGQRINARENSTTEGKRRVNNLPWITATNGFESKVMLRLH
jgi:hypothetical protein